MAMSLHDVSVSCGGLWNVTWTIISGNGGLKANATVTSLDLVVDLVKDPVTGLVNYSKVCSCNAFCTLP